MHPVFLQFGSLKIAEGGLNYFIFKNWRQIHPR